jgi:hypothetical protein
VNQSDEYDWDMLASEIEECPTSYVESEYQLCLKEAVDHFEDWVIYKRDLPSAKLVKRKKLAEIVRTYQEDRDAKIIPILSGYQTMKLDKGKVVEPYKENCENHEDEMEREWAKANGIIDDFDNESFEDIRDDIDTL